jgi:hypothetical protein
MKIKNISVVFQTVASVLFLFSFFLPINRLKSFISIDVSIMDRDGGALLITLFILLAAGAVFYSFKKEDSNKTGLLITMILFFCFSAYFFFDSTLRLETSEYAVISMGFAPFYALIISIAFTFYYVKSEVVLRKMIELLSNTKTRSDDINNVKHDIYSELSTIKNLYDKGIINEEEYGKQKENLLKKIDRQNDQ